MQRRWLEALVVRGFQLQRKDFERGYSDIMRCLLSSRRDEILETQCRASCLRILLHHNVAPRTVQDLLRLYDTSAKCGEEVAKKYRSATRAVLHLPQSVHADWKQSLALLSWTIQRLQSPREKSLRLFHIAERTLYHVPARDVLRTLMAVMLSPAHSQMAVTAKVLCRWASIAQKREKRSSSLCQECKTFGSWTGVAVEGKKVILQWNPKSEKSPTGSMYSILTQRLLEGQWQGVLEHFSKILQLRSDNRVSFLSAPVARKLGVDGRHEDESAPLAIVRSDLHETLPHSAAAAVISMNQEVISQWRRHVFESKLLEPHPKYQARDDVLTEYLVSLCSQCVLLSKQRQYAKMILKPLSCPQIAKKNVEDLLDSPENYAFVRWVGVCAEIGKASSLLEDEDMQSIWVHPEHGVQSVLNPEAVGHIVSSLVLQYSLYWSDSFRHRLQERQLRLMCATITKENQCPIKGLLRGAFHPNVARTVHTCLRRPGALCAMHLVGRAQRVPTQLPTLTARHVAEVIVSFVEVDVGDILRHAHQRHQRNSAKKLSDMIICHEKNVAAIFKPAGVPMMAHAHSDMSVSSALATAARWECEDGGVSTYCQMGLLNRIDFLTSGIVFAATSEETLLKCRRRSFIDQQSEKVYLALVKRRDGPTLWLEPSGTFSQDILAEDGVGGSSDFDSRKALTHYTVIERFPRSAILLVKIFLRVGRRHQIRQHFAQANHPLCADTTYDREASFDIISRVALHVLRTVVDGIAVALELPPDFINALHKLRRIETG